MRCVINDNVGIIYIGQYRRMKCILSIATINNQLKYPMLRMNKELKFPALLTRNNYLKCSVSVNLLNDEGCLLNNTINDQNFLRYASYLKYLGYLNNILCFLMLKHYYTG